MIKLYKRIRTRILWMGLVGTFYDPNRATQQSQDDKGNYRWNVLFLTYVNFGGETWVLAPDDTVYANRKDRTVKVVAPDGTVKSDLKLTYDVSFRKLKVKL